MTNLKDKNGNPIELKQPAFLVGNGINLADDMSLSWSNLLIGILPKKIRNEIQQAGKQKTLEQCLQGLTYPEIAELADLHYKKNANNNKAKTPSIKRQICDSLDNRRNKTHKDFIDFCIKNNIPVLTTNFDHRLISNLKIKKKDGIEMPFWFLTKEEKINKHLIPYQHPFRAYFAEKEFNDDDDINNKFAVWHVHGTKKYINSICINNVDYARNIAEIDKLIRNKEPIGENWVERHSWIDIFMRNDLVILGFALDSAETDIRWLLRERYIYLQYKNKNKPVSTQTIYIYNQDKEAIEMPFGKKAFFDAFDIKCVPMKQNDIFKLEYLSGKK